MTEQAQGQVTPDGTDAQGSQDSPAFDQESVKKIAANEKREGKKAREAELLKATGYETVDDLMAAATEYRALQEATETEADKANKRAETYEARFREANARYEGTLRTYAFRDALRDSGINAERIPAALRLADLDKLEIDESGAVSGIEDAVNAVREASPEWFADTQPGPRRSPDASGAPSSTADAIELFNQRLRQAAG
jgi:hypothetical protein